MTYCGVWNAVGGVGRHMRSLHRQFVDKLEKNKAIAVMFVVVVTTLNIIIISLFLMGEVEIGLTVLGYAIFAMIFWTGLLLAIVSI